MEPLDPKLYKLMWCYWTEDGWHWGSELTPEGYRQYQEQQEKAQKKAIPAVTAVNCIFDNPRNPRNPRLSK